MGLSLVKRCSFYEEYGELVFTPEARRPLWAVQGIRGSADPDVMDGPMVKVARMGSDNQESY